MTNTVLQLTESKEKSKSTEKESIDFLKSRQSKSLVLGICGAVGSGFRSFVETTKDELELAEYEVHVIRVSKLIEDISRKHPSLTPVQINSSTERYIKLQELGNKIRHDINTTYLSQAVITEISKTKAKIKKSKEIDLEEKDIGEVAFIIDQIKHPHEVELLRLVYPHNFYMFGILRNENERIINLSDEGIIQKDIYKIITEDKKSEDKTGQQTENTILDSDFFINNNTGNKAAQKKEINRCIQLIHSKNGITPTIDEKGMYAAFTASLNSACLSRQVGAAILNDNGDILATGRNDVPKAFGGLYYTTKNAEDDHRCIHKGGHCFNDEHKNKIREKIKGILSTYEIKLKNKEGVIDDVLIDPGELALRIFKETPISSIIEYSRAIHAEMDAITTLARNTGETTNNKVLYATTYPCHNCARHIVASGIKRVIFIEPYDKSLAILLHNDSISETNDNEKVNFQLFEGVSPRRYQKLFFSTGDRKDETGKATFMTAKYGNHIDIQLLDAPDSYELKILKDFTASLQVM